MQTASNFFLGWSTNPDGDHSYIRYFRDWKGSVDVARLNAKGLSDYGELCAWTIAKALAPAAIVEPLLNISVSRRHLQLDYRKMLCFMLR
jgi:hypothetical protein